MFTNLRRLVHRCPQVPTAEKIEARTAISISLSGIMIVALFPPSSRIVLPNRLCTISLTLRPIDVDPVNETSSKRGSLINRFPISSPDPFKNYI